MPDPSTKNGRRSEKNVSKAVRLTTAGSASTCPKSGLIVVVSVRPGATAYFRSTPSAASTADAFRSGLPPGACRVRLLTAYGTSSSRLGARLSVSAPSSPNDETYPFALRARSGQVTVSLRRPISRTTARPTVFDSPGAKRSCENGIRNSAVQPSALRDTATFHTASQLSSRLLSLYQYRSCLTPAGFTANSYAVRRSWYESISTRIQSDGEGASRRVR